jgi:hypothetical protein
MFSSTIRRFHMAALLAACLSLLTAGCGHPTVNVTAAESAPALKALTAEPKPLDGIPFYVKRGMCKRETVWAEPRYTLQLAILESGKPYATRSITYPHSFQQTEELKTLVAKLNLLAAPPKGTDSATLCNPVIEAAREWKEADEKESKIISCDVAPRQSGCEPLTAAEANGDLLRISNTANIVAEVDYEHVYYMNTKTPWIGNASVNTELNTDGTLSKGNAQVTDSTWSTILSAVSSLGGNVATLGSAQIAATASERDAGNKEVAVPNQVPKEAVCEAPPGWPVPSADVVYRLTSSTEIYLHDHVLEDTDIGVSCKPSEGGVTEGNITITKLDSAKAKDDSGAIKVSGTVTMPKAAATPPK